MNRFTASITAVALSLGLASGAWACPMHGGEIANINRDTNRIVVVKGDDMASFRADPAKTTITLNGKESSLAELKPGDRINVNFDMKEQITKIEAMRGEA